MSPSGEHPHSSENGGLPSSNHTAAPTKVKLPRKKPQKKDRKVGAAADLERQQQQRDREFAQHKAHILSNLSMSACDLSPKGTVDVKCHSIMDLLNSHEDYITTSSCSGRIALFHSCTEGGDGGGEATKKLKRGASAALGWIVVKHGVLLPHEMALIVRYLCGEAATDADRSLDEAEVAHWETVVREGPTQESYAGELEGFLVSSATEGGLPSVIPTTGTIALKMEPFVMHVECRTMESAKLLLSAAVSDGGYRNSGVVPPGRKIMCGIRSAAGLGMEVPVVLDGCNYVGTSRRYVWRLLEMANEKMHANEKKSKALVECIAARLRKANMQDHPK